MSTHIRGKRDEYIDQIAAALAEFDQQHPAAKIDLYRYERGYVRVRIIDPAFSGRDIIERERMIWKILEEKLSEDVVAEISFLILLTPEETAASLANLEFEHPSPSLL